MKISQTTMRWPRFYIMVRNTIGLITGGVGVADMLSAIVPKLHWDILLGTWPIDVHASVHSLTVIVGFLLIMLSYGLMRGKRQAWLITQILLISSALLHILRGGSKLATVVALLLAMILFVLTNFFRARSDPPALWRGYLALIAGLGIVISYSIGGFFAFYNPFDSMIDHFGLDVVIQTHLRIPPGTPAFFFEKALPLLCASAVLYGMVHILHPVATALLPDEGACKKISDLIHSFGKSSISYFALSEEKSYFFSRSGQSVISYVLEGTVAVVAGDPIGPIEEMQTVIDEFTTYCQQQDWTLVFWQVRGELADLYRAAGLRLLKIGEDAIINTNTFTLKGGAMANVRSSAKRSEKDGVRIIFYQGCIDDTEQRTQLEQISQTWLANKGGSEMGFSMGHFDAEGDDEQWTALAIDQNNRVHAFVTFVPIYGRCGWGLDLMRRAEVCAPGTMELLLARSIEHLKSGGAQMVSLGLAPLSNINNDNETFLDTSIEFLTQRFGNLSHSQSLFKFKQKFHPTWESRYLAFSNTLALPKIGWALYAAHQQDASWLSMLRRSFKHWQHQHRADQPEPTRQTSNGSLSFRPQQELPLDS